MAVRDLIVLNTTQSRLEPHQGSDTARLKGGSTELLRLADGNDVAVMTVRSLSPGMNISGSITGSSISGSESSTGSFYYVDVDQMSGNANQIKDILNSGVVSSSAQLAVAISGSWQGEFSSSAKLFISGGVSGSEESTGSFSLLKSTTLFGSGQYLTDVLGHGTLSASAATFDFYDETISDEISGSWKNILDYSGSFTKMRDHVASHGGVSGSGTQAGNLQINTIISGSETSTGSFDKVHIDHLVGDGTFVTGIMPAGVISSSVSTNLTSSTTLVQNINKNFSFSGSNDYGNSRHSPRFDIAHDNQQSNGIDSKNFTISYWDFPWGFVHNTNVIRKESAYTLEKYQSSNTFFNRYEFRAGFGNTTFSLSGSYSGSYWHNIVFVREGTNAKLYMQGELACTVPVGTGTLDNDTNPLTLMTSHNGNYPQNGAFGGYAMWDQGLSGSEVRSIYNHGEPTNLNHTWNDYTQTGSLILWLNPASSSFDSTATNGVSPEGTWTIADSSVRNNMFATSSGMNESSRSDHHPIGHILGTQDPTFNLDVSGSFTGFLSSSTTVTSSVRFSGSLASTGSFDSLDVNFLEGDGSELTGIQPEETVSSSVQLSGISGSWRAFLSGSKQLIMSSSFSGSAASTGSFDVLYADVLRGDASEVTGLNIPSGTLSSSNQITDQGSALSSLASGSWSDVSSSLANRYVASASGAVNQSVTAGSSPTFVGVNVTDTVFYRELIVSSSDSNYSSSFASGSTVYGDDSADTHEVTGSINTRLPLENRYSFKFDGTSDAFTVTDPAIFHFGARPFTISVWVKFLAQSNYDILLSTVNTANSQGWYFNLDDSSPNKVKFDYHNGSATLSLVSSTAIPLNKWTLVTVATDKKYIRMYHDTTKVGQQAWTGTITTGDNLMMGWEDGWSSAYGLNGMLNEVAMWDTGLSGSEIQALYNEGIPIDLNEGSNNPHASGSSYQHAGNLISWWRMGESASFDDSTSVWTIADQAASASNHWATSSNMTIASAVQETPTISSSLGAGDGKTFFTVQGNISGSAQSSGSFGNLAGSGDGLSDLVYSASRADQAVWKGETDSFNIPTGSTAERAFITGSAPQYVSASGMMRFNSTENNFEGWDGRNWIVLVQGSANSISHTISGSIAVSGSIPGQRGVFGGRFPQTLPTNNIMDFITISTGGDAADYGDLRTTTQTRAMMMCSNGIGGRGLTTQGKSSNQIDYIDLSQPSNAVDFGSLTVSVYKGNEGDWLTNGSDSRAVFVGGRYPVDETMDFLNITTIGDAIDFGDLTADRVLARGESNGLNQRGVMQGGANAVPIGPHSIPDIEYITISTAGNSLNFGYMRASNYKNYGGSNDINERGVFLDTSDTLDMITISTPSDAIEWSDDHANYRTGADTGRTNHGWSTAQRISNGTDDRGVTGGGGPGRHELIQYITFSTPSQAIAFGNLTHAGDEVGAASTGAR
tara:strand:- start:163 stop:4515 length:4353 start_codon:yes stop_codon:yes gene_type:complete